VQFIKCELGYQRRGSIVVVTLSGNQANVRLMTPAAFNSFRSGRRYSFQGGRATRSPVRIPIPRDGNWVVVVDMQGLRGTVRASARVEPGPLPALRPIQQATALAEDGYGPIDDGVARDYDVFISYATEDKDDFVRPLVTALTAQDLVVWYDEFSLSVGDSLRRGIDRGLANSRFGTVVLSGSFFAKNWPQYELDGLVAKEMQGRKVILPIWHNLTKDELLRHSPSLADKVAIRSSDFTIEEIAEQIALVVNGAQEAA
jgi:hypothetical protein